MLLNYKVVDGADGGWDCWGEAQALKIIFFPPNAGYFITKLKLHKFPM